MIDELIPGLNGAMGWIFYFGYVIIVSWTWMDIVLPRIKDPRWFAILVMTGIAAICYMPVWIMQLIRTGW